jgi:glyoxylase-like metal-dependent hydrolase (beta-lactamase superfamily II)
VAMVQEQRAQRTTVIGPNIYHWWLADERIDGAQSDSYAMYTRAGFVFVDPLPMTYVAADLFPAVSVCFLTRGCHQRACWRYQYEHGARVLSPRGSPGLRTEPDQHYVEGTRLSADFRAIHTPGPEYNHYALFRPGEPSMLFVGELVRRFDPESPLEITPVEPGLDPELGRRSVEKLLELEFDMLCLSHGGYIDVEPKLELSKLLDRG